MENNPSTPVPGAEQNVPAAERTENVTPAVDLNALNAATGRNYASVDEAIKGVSETYKFVSKKTEPQIVEKVVVPPDVEAQLKSLGLQLKETQFYADHPELKAHKELLKKFGDPEEAMKDPAVKSVLDIVKAHSETENQKSVLNSNRVAVPAGADYEQDLAAMREGSLPVGEFLAKHKGVKLQE